MLLLPLKDILPFKITDNVPSDPSRVYDFEWTYGENELVNDGEFVYESVDADNLNNTPNASPLKWNKTRIVNQHAYTDRSTSMQSQSVNDLHFEYTLNNDTFMMLTGLVGTTVKIKIEDMDDSSIVYYDEEFPLSFSESGMDWYTWMNPSLQPTIYKDRITMNIEPRYNQRLIIDITKDESRGGSAIANLIFGVPIEVGCTIMGVKRGLKSSSKIETVDGVKKVIEREGYNTLDVDVFVEDNDRNNTIFSTLKEYRDTPVVAIGSTEDDMYQIYGIFNDIDYAIDYSATYTISMSSLETDRKNSEPMKRLHGGTFVIDTVDKWNWFFNDANPANIEFTSGKGFEYFNKYGEWKSTRLSSFVSFNVELTTDSSTANIDESHIEMKFKDTSWTELLYYNDNTTLTSWGFQRMLRVYSPLALTSVSTQTKDTLYTHSHACNLAVTHKAKEIDFINFTGNLRADWTSGQSVHNYINNITFTECIFR